eukprot:gnl/Dysnectes_brevis/2205_a2571_2812.p1 GENE.gnl/Dysnectes_brevis/2205_a2571_2812~~gnl/Dysnectes_brevis/2205_a2571_2812.p1  ORF type:complete len:131 (-),score=14.61 gnl/Dysnectes_brevis/2205_a2571_2812:131-523(-)
MSKDAIVKPKYLDLLKEIRSVDISSSLKPVLDDSDQDQDLELNWNTKTSQTFMFWSRFFIGLFCGLISGVIGVTGIIPIVIASILLFIPYRMVALKTDVAPLSDMVFHGLPNGIAIFILLWVVLYSSIHH